MRDLFSFGKTLLDTVSPFFRPFHAQRDKQVRDEEEWARRVAELGKLHSQQPWDARQRKAAEGLEQQLRIASLTALGPARKGQTVFLVIGVPVYIGQDPGNRISIPPVHDAWNGKLGSRVCQVRADPDGPYLDTFETECRVWHRAPGEPERRVRGTIALADGDRFRLEGIRFQFRSLVVQEQDEPS